MLSISTLQSLPDIPSTLTAVRTLLRQQKASLCVLVFSCRVLVIVENRSCPLKREKESEER